MHKDKQLRKMLVDCLRYIHKGSKYGYRIERETVEVGIDTCDTTSRSVCLSEIIKGIDPADYENVLIQGSSYEDFDGFTGSQIELYYYRKQTDQEYFESVCSYILPTDYQVNQYNEYLRLKAQFEGYKQ